MPTRLLDGAAVRSVLEWPDTIDAIQDAFAGAARQGALVGAAAQVDPPRALLHLKAGGFAEPPLLTVKANIRPEGGRAFGVVLVFDHQQQRLRAVLDSGDVTAIRTAATAVVAARALGAREGATVAVIGAGPVGRRIVEALPYALQLGALRLWSRDPGRATELAVVAPADVPHQVFDTPAEAAAEADVVITCTPSRAPLLTAADLAEHALVLAMGSDSPGKRELAGDLLAGASIVADDPAAAIRVGESAYLPEPAALPVELGAVLLDPSLGQKLRDGSPSRRIVFDSVGTAFTDTAAAGVIVRLAEERSLGSYFAFQGL